MIPEAKKTRAVMAIVAMSLTVAMVLGGFVTLAVDNDGGSDGGNPAVQHTIGYSTVPIGYSVQITYGSPDDSGGVVEVADGDEVPDGAEITIGVARDENAFLDYLREVLGETALNELFATGNVAGLAGALPEDDVRSAPLIGALEDLAERSGNASGSLLGGEGSQQPGGLSILSVPGTEESGMVGPVDNRARVLALLLPESFGVRVNGSLLAGSLPDFGVVYLVEADAFITVEPRYGLGAAPMAYNISGDVITIDGHSHRNNSDDPDSNSIVDNSGTWECIVCGTNLGIDPITPGPHHQYECDVALWVASVETGLTINFSGEDDSLDPGITQRYLDAIKNSSKQPAALAIVGDDPVLGANSTQPDAPIDLKEALNTLDLSASAPVLTIMSADLSIDGTVTIPADYTVSLIDQDAGRISDAGILEVVGTLHVTGTPSSGGVADTDFDSVKLTVDGGTVSGDSRLAGLGAIAMTASGGSIGNHLASNDTIAIAGGTVERGVTVETGSNSSPAVTISGGAIIKGRVMATDPSAGITLDDAVIGEEDHVATDDHEDGVVQSNGGTIRVGTTASVDVSGGVIRSLQGDIDFREGSVTQNNEDSTRGRLEAWGGTVTVGTNAEDIHRINASSVSISGTTSGNVISLVGGNNITISGAEYDYLFAAGPGTTVTSSTIVNAFAGPEYAPQGNLGDVDYRPEYSGSSLLTIANGSAVSNLYAGGRYSIADGGNNKATVVVDGNVGNAYLGGDGPEGSTLIPTALSLQSGGTVGNIYGGGTRGDGASVADAAIDISTGTVTGSIFGGYDDRDSISTQFPAPYTDVGSDGGRVEMATIDLSHVMAPDSADGGSIYGGGRVGAVSEVVININSGGQVGGPDGSSGTWGGTVYGGSPGAGDVDDVTITLNNGGRVMQDVYGGSASSGNVATSTIDYNGSVIDGEHGIHGGGSGTGNTGNSTININSDIKRGSGQQFTTHTSHIYGGGGTGSHSFSDNVNGPVTISNININATIGEASTRWEYPSGINYTDVNVYGGSRDTGTVGESTITIGSVNTNASFPHISTPGVVVGNVYGGGRGSGTVGTTNIHVGGSAWGEVNGNVFGGGTQVGDTLGDRSGEVTTAHIKIGYGDDGYVQRNVYGGAEGYGTVQDVDINIGWGNGKTGYVFMDVYGGAGVGMHNGGSGGFPNTPADNPSNQTTRGQITNKTTVEIGRLATSAIGHVGGTVFGGGENVGATNGWTDVKEAEINFNKGTVGEDIGSNATTVPSNNTKNSADQRWGILGGGRGGVVETATVNYNARNSTDVIKGDIHGGGTRGTVNYANVYIHTPMHDDALEMALTQIHSGVVYHNQDNGGGHIYGGGHRGDNASGSKGTVGAALVEVKDTGAVLNNHVYGGSSPDGGTVGGATVNIHGPVGATGNQNVYGGGAGADDVIDVVNGTEFGTVVTINADVGGHVYGGGEDSSVVRSTSVHQTGGTVSGSVYGGGTWHGWHIQPNVSSTVGGNTMVHIAGGTVNTNVYGGGHGSADNANHVNTSSNLLTSKVVVGDGGTALVKGEVYGGGWNAGASNTDVRIATGGTVETNVYGGGRAEASTADPAALPVGTTTPGTTAADALISGGTRVTVEGGTVGVDPWNSSTYGGVTTNHLNGSVYGGGYGSRADSVDANVDGNTYVEVNAGAVHYDVYGGGLSGRATTVPYPNDQDTATVGQGTIVRVTGSGQVFHDIHGGGRGLQGQVNSMSSPGTHRVVSKATVGYQVGALQSGVVHGSVYGGGVEDAWVNGSAQVDILHNGYVMGDVFGGGTTTDDNYSLQNVNYGGNNGNWRQGTMGAKVTGHAAVNVQGENTGTGYDSPNSIVDPALYPMVNGSVYGGGKGRTDVYFASDDCTIMGTNSGNYSTVVRILGGRVAVNSGTGADLLDRANVYGGGMDSNTQANVYVLVDQYGIVGINRSHPNTGSVFGGGIYTGAMIMNAGSDNQIYWVNGNTEVMISGHIHQSVWGGGHWSDVMGKTRVDITDRGATFDTGYAVVDLDVIGGGLNANVLGDSGTVVNVGAGARVRRDVYGGGWNTTGIINAVGNVQHLYHDIKTQVTIAGSVGVDTGIRYIEPTAPGGDPLMGDGSIGGNGYLTGNSIMANDLGNPDYHDLFYGHTSASQQLVSDRGGNVFGGGYGYGNVHGDAVVLLQDGCVVMRDVFGGGYLGEITGDRGTDVTLMSNGRVYGTVYGGGFGRFADITQDTRVVIYGEVGRGDSGPKANNGSLVPVMEGSTPTWPYGYKIPGNVYGGGSYGDVHGSQGTSVVVASMARVSNNVYGGGFEGQVTHSKATAQVLVNDGAQVWHSVFGGGHQREVNIPAATRDATVANQTDVRVDNDSGRNTRIGHPEVAGASGTAPDEADLELHAGRVFGGGEYALVDTETNVVVRGLEQTALHTVSGGSFGRNTTDESMPRNVTLENMGESKPVKDGGAYVNHGVYDKLDAYLVIKHLQDYTQGTIDNCYLTVYHHLLSAEDGTEAGMEYAAGYSSTFTTHGGVYHPWQPNPGAVIAVEPVMAVPDGDTFFRMEAGHAIDMSKGGFALAAGAPPVELLIDHPKDSASVSWIYGPGTPGASQVSVAQLAYNYLPRTLSSRDLVQNTPGDVDGIRLYMPPVVAGTISTDVDPGTNQQDVPTSWKIVIDFGQMMDTGSPGVVELYNVELGTQRIPVSSFEWDRTGTILTAPYFDLAPGKIYWILTSSFQNANGVPVPDVAEEGLRYFETSLLAEQPRITSDQQSIIMGEEVVYQISMGTGAYRANRAEIVRFSYSPLQLEPLSGHITDDSPLRLYADETGVSTFRVNFYRGSETQPFHSVGVSPSARDYYYIAVTANPDGLGTVTGDAIVNYGDTHTVTATPAHEAYFVNWTEQGQEVSRDPEYTFTVDWDRHLTANFIPKPLYQVEVSAQPSKGGTVTGDATVMEGETHTVRAWSNPSYRFTRWTENGRVVSYDEEYSFTATENRDLVANFVFVRESNTSHFSNSTADTISALPEYLIDPPEMRRLIAVADQNSWDFARASSSLTTTVKAEAWKLLEQRRFVARTVVENAVQVQLTFLHPTELTNDMQVSGTVNGLIVNSRKALFEKWFQNRIEIVHLDHAGPFDQRVYVAAKVDLTGMDTHNLHIYRYDRQANKYILIGKPNQQQYRIDGNGYLHFTTEHGGDFVISDGVLLRK